MSHPTSGHLASSAMHRSSSHPILATVLGVLFVITGAACGGGETNGSPPPPSPPSTVERSSYPGVVALADALTAGGMSCTLEYEGLRDDTRELSLCTISGEQATLSIYNDPAIVDAFLASTDDGIGSTAVGANWTIDVDSLALATELAQVLGGTVKP